MGVLVYSIFVKNDCKERQIMFRQVIACNEKLSIPVWDNIDDTLNVMPICLQVSDICYLDIR